MKYQRIIGIDPGTKTGMAVWDGMRLTTLISGSLTEIQDILLRFAAVHSDILIRVEDARKRKWFGKAGRERLQGAGSIKRDCAIWDEWLRKNKFEFEMICPLNVKTKIKSEPFENLTGYTGSTNQHMRDAGMLVFNYKMEKNENFNGRKAGQ